MEYELDIAYNDSFYGFRAGKIIHSFAKYYTHFSLQSDFSTTISLTKMYCRIGMVFVLW